MEPLEPIVKECTSCKKSKALDEFYNKTKIRKMATCKTCYNKKVSIYRKQPTTKVKRRLTQKKTRAASKTKDLLKVKITNLRQSMRSRAKKLGISMDEVPSTSELRLWIDAQIPWKCYYSGETVTLSNLSIDHKIPLHRNGSNLLENLCIVTRQINGAKGTMTDTEFTELLSIISKWEDNGAAVLTRLRQSIYGR